MNLATSLVTLLAATLSMFVAIDIVITEIGRRKRWKRITVEMLATAMRISFAMTVIVWLNQ